MKIAILGTRGIPNNYGGFEQFAEYFAWSMARKGHEVYVYNSHTHPYQHEKWNGVTILHKHDPENKIGTFGQFIYDLNCIRDARKRKFDIILQLGYTSNSVWGWMLPRKAMIITNMDGLEWKRSKYHPMVRKFLVKAEKWAVNTSDFLIADSPGIQRHLKEKYQKESFFIPYGATIFDNPNILVLDQYNLKPWDYYMLIARMEPENNIEMILSGMTSTEVDKKILVIGDYEATGFGRKMKEKFGKDKRVQFLGPIYNLSILNNLRYYCSLYFHGHTVGGTNPSLLEAMASQAVICAHKNEFNAAVLGDHAYYFETDQEVKQHIEERERDQEAKNFILENIRKIQAIYDWDIIANSYESFMKEKLNSADDSSFL